MQHTPDTLLQKIELEQSATSKLEAHLADLCFTLQHYENIFAECAKVVGSRWNKGNCNVDRLVLALFLKLQCLRSANFELRLELTNLETPLLPNKGHRPVLTRIEADDVWRLYTQVNNMLTSIDGLKAQLKQLKQQNLQLANTLRFHTYRARSAPVSESTDSDISFEAEKQEKPERQPLREVTKAVLSKINRSYSHGNIYKSNANSQKSNTNYGKRANSAALPKSDTENTAEKPKRVRNRVRKRKGMAKLDFAPTHSGGRNMPRPEQSR